MDLKMCVKYDYNELSKILKCKNKKNYYWLIDTILSKYYKTINEL